MTLLSAGIINRPTGPTYQLIEDFEAGTLDAYSVEDASAFDVQSSIVRSGSYALRLVPNNSAFDHIYSDPGGPTPLPNYAGAGDTFEIAHRIDGTAGHQAHVFWCVQSEGSNLFADGYDIRFAPDDITLIAYQNGSVSVSSKRTFSWPANEWCTTTVEHASDGTITVTARDASGTQLGQPSISSTLFSSGGFGIVDGFNNSDTVYFDDIRIVE